VLKSSHSVKVPCLLKRILCWLLCRKLMAHESDFELSHRVFKKEEKKFCSHERAGFMQYQALECDVEMS
jgi:hypothetical protein